MSEPNNNTGEKNTGNWNSGVRNSGVRNSGNGNSGNWNSGNRNSGYANSGNWNSGNENSGDWNSGDWNTGYGNATNRSSGIFCSTKSTIRIFNKETELNWDEINHPNFNELYVNKWVTESDMTEEEKEANPKFYVREGYLRTYEWKEAWVNFWRDTDEENRQKFIGLPNFDAEVFKEITGIEVGEKPTDPEVIELNGKKYQLVK